MISFFTCASNSAAVSGIASTPSVASFCLTAGASSAFCSLGVKLGDDLRRRPRRHEHAHPERVVGIRIAGFQRGRDVRQRGGALRAADGEAHQPPVADVRQRRRDRAEIVVDPAGDDLGDGFGAALERDVDRVVAGAQTEALRAQMHGRAYADGCEVGRVGIGLRPGHVVLHGLDAFRRRDDHDVRHAADGADGDEVARHVVGQAWDRSTA